MTAPEDPFKSLKDDKSFFLRGARKETRRACAAAAVLGADIIMGAYEIPPSDSALGKFTALVIGGAAAYLATRATIGAVADYQFAAVRDTAITTLEFKPSPKA